MERKRVATAFMIVSCLGIIITAVGRFAAIGVGLGETAYIAFDSTFAVFIMLFFIAIAMIGQDSTEDEKDQPEAEQDSSLY